MRGNQEGWSSFPVGRKAGEGRSEVAGAPGRCRVLRGDRRVSGKERMISSQGTMPRRGQTGRKVSGAGQRADVGRPKGDGG